VALITILSDGRVEIHVDAAQSNAYLDLELKEGMRYMRYEAYKNDEPGVIEAACQQAKEQLGFDDALVEKLRGWLSK
jgi:hypothetical protein